jgi:hypothetical protein
MTLEDLNIPSDPEDDAMDDWYVFNSEKLT